ncbi:amidase family protein [Silanimonas sp.]|jgi:amidase|uniref:amidase family protein n=1 Tax=Silanimonas sp. TaxID=1929290 RepID=UPI0022BFB308|nr:amidase family protein [Silanimonas sp.]MCZ8115484.1 amidase family protein [Silanimonas sp.]
MIDGPWARDALNMRETIRRGEESAAGIVEAAVRAAELIDARLNFLACADFERALETAKRIDRAAAEKMPFAGVPFLVKDLRDVPGLPTRAGSRSRRDATAAASPDPYVERFTRAGMVVIGKSATSEFGFLPTTEPLASKPTRNPWNPDLSSGGSSGGAAVAVAAGVVPVAHASDGGGSIRIPAAYCGVFGLKPSRERLLPPRGRRRPIDIAVQHVVSRSVRDSAAMLALTESPDTPFAPIGMVFPAAKSRSLTIGVAACVRSKAPDTAAALKSAADLVEALGHDVMETEWPFGDAFMDDFLDYWALGAGAEVGLFEEGAGRAAGEADFEPFTLHMAERAQRIGEADQHALMGRLRDAMKRYDEWLSAFDLILSPVAASPAPPLGWIRGDVPFRTLLDRLRQSVVVTPISNVAGAPAMSVPLHWTDQGLPVGVQFAAARGDEATLLQLAYALEEACPWAGRLPALAR